MKGNTYAMNLTFQAKAPSNTATVTIFGRLKLDRVRVHAHIDETSFFQWLFSCYCYVKGIIGGIPVPFPLPESDACKLGVKCPVNPNDVNVATLALTVLPIYPSISLYAKLEIPATDQKNDYVCLLFPATIIDGAHQKRNLVGWRRGQLFDKLN
jgi:hypothetical protein